MRTDLPAEHISEAHKLEAKGYVDLVELKLFNPEGGTVFLYICAQKPVTWQGKTWERVEHSISEFAQSSSGELSRPKFTIVNPGSVFSRYAHQGYFNNALVSRYRVLTSDIDTNTNSFQFHVWRVSKVLNIGPHMVVTEMRSSLDGHAFFLPARTYRPPTFPTVSPR